MVHLILLAELKFSIITIDIGVRRELPEGTMLDLNLFHTRIYIYCKPLYHDQREGGF